MTLTILTPRRLGLTVVATALVIPAIVLVAPHAEPKAQPAGTTETSTSPSRASARKALVNAQILAFNDFHGRLEPDDLSISAATGTSHGKGWVPAGGGAYLAAKIKAAQRSNPDSVVVSAGDMVGASPMLSGYYHDRPTIEAMNQILDVGVVGNHEFDKGTAEARRVLADAKFDVLAANVIVKKTGRPLFKPYVIKDVGGAKVAFIGTVTTDTRTFVPSAGIKDVTIEDEKPVIEKLLPEVRAQADAVVVLTHSGADRSTTGINGCANVKGPAADLAKGLEGQVDAVVSAHSHNAYNCRYGSTLLTSAASYGRLLTTLKMTIDPNEHRVTRSSASNAIVNHQGPQDKSVAAIIKRYRAQIAPLADAKVGHLTRGTDNTPDAAGESSFGDLVADAQLQATKPAGAQIAMMNLGFIRSQLKKGTVTYADVYTAQPFGHRLITMTLTGTQLDAMLEEEFCAPGPDSQTARADLGFSAGFSYIYSLDAACGHRVNLTDIRLDDRPIRADGRYRLTAISFFATGDDNFTTLAQGTDRITGMLDRDALAQYLTKHPDPVMPTPGKRIRMR